MRKRRKKSRASYGGFLAAIRRTSQGRKALSRYRRFWGLKDASTIKRIDLPGPKNKLVVLAGLGNVPEIELADGPRNRFRRKWKIKRPGMLATDASGKRLYILRSRPRKTKPRFLGWVSVTNYLPSPAMERDGTFKRGKWWRHHMGEDGGNWAKAWTTKRGDIIYEKGGNKSRSGKATYKIGKWLYD